ncbi:hypothetical protein EHQ96_13660 [Leptospira levettii]|uniref:Uncharacterized protein n=1 Tax=Leptospira levettii TaxID=2023178 RepID=A0A5F2CYJ9_9LEPT|nr:hypothetical protein [Leptospira levettii]PKA25886.1 hypothetical protein CH381_13450 [Leptospira sp. mixed culture ATI2-C-A1]MCW7464242.1 hypothetical protein [Leptospira levettii]MCW7472835.1 hypothetical protein [Leptospira levettii]MCW7495688.1 hypothetical protein [Leptospira levettii]MCW7508518.1 hypothetical protein [Leptospira levettii]
MFVSFVENKYRKKPEPSDGSPSLFFQLWLGLAFIFVFSVVLLPFGVYWPLSHSIWILLVFFLPLVFIGIHFIKSSGYIILFAVFLSLLAGGNVLLFLGDAIGYKLGLTSQFDVLPEESHLALGNRYLYLREFYLDDSDSGSFRSPLLVRRRSGSVVYGPVITFQYKRIRAVSGKDTKLPMYALCYSKENGNCSVSSLFSGGVLLKETIWETKETKLNQDSIFIIWKDRLDSEYETKGIFSFLFLILLHLVWGIVVYLPLRN